MDTDPTWFKDFKIIIHPDRLTEFVITQNTSFNEKLNAILRFSIYSSILLFVYRRNYIILLFPIFTAGLTLYLAKFRTMDKEQIIQKRSLGQPKCTMPTAKNPYMNALISDYDNPKRPPACDPNDPVIAKQVDKFMNRNQYRNANDLYDENNFNRQFNTQPVTTVSQEEYDNFVNWVHKDIRKSCKEDTRNCKVYEDIRFKRTVV